jgi:hypothetical protein
MSALSWCVVGRHREQGRELLREQLREFANVGEPPEPRESLRAVG